MAKSSWFSDEGDDLLFTTYVDRMDSWKGAIADGRVTPEEVRGQAERVADLMRDLEGRLDDELHAFLTNVFIEWAVLQGLQSLALAQDATAAASSAGEARQ